MTTVRATRASGTAVSARVPGRGEGRKDGEEGQRKEETAERRLAAVALQPEHDDRDSGECRGDDQHAGPRPDEPEQREHPDQRGETQPGADDGITGRGRGGGGAGGHVLVDAVPKDPEAADDVVVRWPDQKSCAPTGAGDRDDRHEHRRSQRSRQMPSKTSAVVAKRMKKGVSWWLTTLAAEPQHDEDEGSLPGYRVLCRGIAKSGPVPRSEPRRRSPGPTACLRCPRDVAGSPRGVTRKSRKLTLRREVVLADPVGGDEDGERDDALAAVAHEGPDDDRLGHEIEHVENEGSPAQQGQRLHASRARRDSLPRRSRATRSVRCLGQHVAGPRDVLRETGMGPGGGKARVGAR